VRRSLAVLIAATAVLGATAAPAAAQTLDIRFQAVTTKPHSTCEATFCAPVSVPGYGEGRSPTTTRALL
jgi:TRAP-type C4-dicarboxylate transport system substrate-binding protein